MPEPRTLRLVGATARMASVKPPFGVAFTDDGEAWCLVLSTGATTVARVTEELPVAPPGTVVYVLPWPGKQTGLLARLSRPPPVPLAIRCTALLARGFTRVGGGVEPRSGLELAWGTA